MYLGDFKEDGDIFFKFTTRIFATGVPGTLANTPVLSVYIDEGTSPKTTAESYFDLDVDFNSKTGLNNVRIDLSGDAFFATGADYAVVITTGTVSSVSVIGETVATFSIENRSMGQPAGATLAADIAAIKTDTAATLIDTTGLNGAAMRGTDSANTTTPPTVGAIADQVWQEAQADHTDSGTFGEMATEIAAIPTTAMRGTDSANTVVPPSVAQFNARTLVAANYLTAADILTTALTESYAANGADPTLVQAILAIHQKIMAFALSGTVSSVKKLDGTTEAFVGTLDDDTNPTSDIRS